MSRIGCQRKAERSESLIVVPQFNECDTFEIVGCGICRIKCQ